MRKIDSESQLAKDLYEALSQLCRSVATASISPDEVDEVIESLPWPDEPMDGEEWNVKLEERIRRAVEVLTEAEATDIKPSRQ